MAVVLYPGIRVTVAESLIRDLGRVSEWCDLWGMKLNASKTKTIIISKSRTMHPLSLPIGGTVLKDSDNLAILGVTFDSKLIFEKHLRLVFRATSQRLGILRKSWREFHDISLLERCFWCFVLPVLKCCSAVWCSAADTHLKLLDRAVSGARSLTGGGFECDIVAHIVWVWHHPSVAVLCMLYKTRCNPMHPVNDALPGPYVPVRVTCGVLVTHRYTYGPPRCRTSEYRRTFVPLSVSLRNDLADTIFDGVGLAGFKNRAMLYYWPKLLFYYFYLSLLSVYRLVLWGRGLLTDGVYITLTQPCTADLF